MFVEIHQLKKSGFKMAQVARRLNLDRKTVSKYWDVQPDEFAKLINRSGVRPRKLDKYEKVIVKWLEEHPDISAAQVEDWLKEHYHDMTLKERTVRSYVAYLRLKYDIPKVVEPSNIKQSRTHLWDIKCSSISVRLKSQHLTKSKKKIYGHKAVSCRDSRHKYAEWSSCPLTTGSLVSMLTNCFEFYGGIPREIVIDQDKLMVVSENYGDIIFTHQFEQFRRKTGFTIRLCRGGDPQSRVA